MKPLITTRFEGIFAPWIGVFETIKVVKGKPLFFREHARKFQEGASFFGFKVPTISSLKNILLPKEDGRLRWILNQEGFRSLFSSERLIEKSLESSFWKLGVSTVRVGSQNWDARYKTLSYLSHFQARQGQGNCDEMVLLNERDEVASAAMANVFWVRGGRIYTPSVECGCRAGVIRDWVMQKEQVIEGRFGVEALQKADEIFLTNSMIGIQGVSHFRGKRMRKENDPDSIVACLKSKY